MASRVRGSAVVAELHAEGVAEERLARLETPAGLDIGARTPEEIALSILARIVAVRRGEQTLSVRVVAPAAAAAPGPATAIDPVCGMAVAAVDQTPHVDHEGRRDLLLLRRLPFHLDTLACPAVGSVAVATRSRRRCTLGTTASAGWPIGLALGIVVILVAATIVITIVALAMRIAKQAKTAEEAVEVVRQQTAELDGIAQINDSGVRILHSARALRKVAVGK